MRHLMKVLAPLMVTAVLLGLSAFPAAAANPALKLNAGAARPGASIHVTGSGFKAHEVVDVYFDTTDLALASANGKGGFAIDITVPSAAQPGEHFITGVGRSSGLSAQVAFTVQTNWSQFHFGPTLTGLNPYENTLTPSDISGLDESWIFSTGGAVKSSPAVVAGRLYVGSDDGNVYALDASTGALDWSVATGAPVDSSPAVANGVVYVGSDNGQVLALQASTGASIWTDDLSSLEPSGFPAPPTVSGGTVYIMGASGTVYALSASDGFAMWAVPSTTCSGAYAPAVKNATVYTSVRCDIEALKASNGSFLWQQEAIGGSAPAVGLGRVFVGAVGEFYGETASGTSNWNAIFFDDNAQITAPALANGVVYAGSIDWTLWTMNAATGAEGWSFKTGGPIASAPAVADGIVYFGSDDGNVYALNAHDGSLLWTAATGGGVESSPAVVNGNVYVGSDDGNVYAFSLIDPPLAVKRPVPSSLHPDTHLLLG